MPADTRALMAMIPHLSLEDATNVLAATNGNLQAAINTSLDN